MCFYRVSFAAVALACGLPACAQLSNQIQLKIDSSNRTLTVSAQERVTAEPEIAIVDIGFITQPLDAKSAYAEGARASNLIVNAIKQAGIEENSIRSESQELESVDSRSHKFRLKQSWVAKVPPARVAEILDIAVSAGATESGEIEWNVNDEKALEDRALEQASAKARSDAEALAKGMGVKLGSLVYVTNQVVNSGGSIAYMDRNFAGPAKFKSSGVAAPELAIEPHKVSRTATVYAIYAIE